MDIKIEKKRNENEKKKRENAERSRATPERKRKGFPVDRAPRSHRTPANMRTETSKIHAAVCARIHRIRESPEQPVGTSEISATSFINLGARDLAKSPLNVKRVLRQRNPLADRDIVSELITLSCDSERERKVSVRIISANPELKVTFPAIPDVIV